jgi:hypothetical protein
MTTLNNQIRLIENEEIEDSYLDYEDDEIEDFDGEDEAVKDSDEGPISTNFSASPTNKMTAGGQQGLCNVQGRQKPMTQAQCTNVKGSFTPGK